MYTDKEYFLTRIKENELNNLQKDKDGNVQEAYLTEAIKTADSEIDSYIRKVVGLPIADADVPEKLRAVSFSIAMYYLHMRIQPDDRPEMIKSDYEAAIKWLDKVAKGTVDLGIEPADAEAKEVSYTVQEPRIDRDSF